MEQLLAIALVHFNTLTVLQLLVTAPSARVWSADHLLLLLYNTVRQDPLRALGKQR